MPDERVVEEAKETSWGLFWWTVAAGLHIGAVIALIYFTPLREWFWAKSDKSAITVSGYRLQKIANELLKAHTEYVREQIEKQRDALYELDRVTRDRYDRYAKEAAQVNWQGPKAAPLDTLPPPGPNPDIPLADLDIIELYRAAQKIDQTVFGTYKRMRTVELARIQRLALDTAYETVTVTPPGEHPPVDMKVFRQAITTQERLKGVKDEVQTIRQEVARMVSYAQRKVDLAMRLQTDDLGVTITMGAGGQFVGGGGTAWGSDVGPSLSPDELFPPTTATKFNPETLNPVPGRKLKPGERAADWMYLDTWYCIGPFPNPQRKYMDKKFPPESVIDLDATYVGKHEGQPLKWEWLQSNRLMIAPIRPDNYAVWYFYTEIYSEEANDYLVAFGSDDYSRAWLNGEPVWTSGETPHHWIPDRGYRTLHLRPGYNTLLVKLENAGGTTGMSVMFFVHPLKKSAGGGGQ